MRLFSVLAGFMALCMSLVATISPATAQSFSEDEAVYIGRVTVLIEVSAQSVSDLQDLFADLIEEPGTWTSPQVLEVSGGGGVFLETTNTESPWTLTFEPL